MVHYLVQEELGKVSYDKLYRALNLTERDQPLRQDQIEHIRGLRAQVTQQLDKADIPIEVIHLINFLAVNKLSIQDMFKVVAGKQITEATMVTQRTFDECCHEKGYEPKDRAKLIQALTQDGARGPGISLFALQAFRRKYDQRNQTARSGA